MARHAPDQALAENKRNNAVGMFTRRSRLHIAARLVASKLLEPIRKS